MIIFTQCKLATCREQKLIFSVVLKVWINVLSANVQIMASMDDFVSQTHLACRQKDCLSARGNAQDADYDLQMSTLIM